MKSNRRAAREADTARARGVRQAKSGLWRQGCEVCGWKPPVQTRRASGLQGHHIVPVSQGGSLDRRNVIVLCPNHHAVAHAIGEIAYRTPSGTIRKAARAILTSWLDLGDRHPERLRAMLTEARLRRAGDAEIEPIHTISHTADAAEIA